MEEFIKEKTKMLDDKYCNLFTTYKGLRQDIVQLIKDSNQVEPLVMQKIAEGKKKFTEDEEKYIWWGVQWAFRPENKNRTFKREEFFNYVYWEMGV